MASFIMCEPKYFSLKESINPWMGSQGSLSITKASKGGITLDTFILHGSKAVSAKNVLVLAGSSRAEVVTYPDQNVIYIQTDCPVQPCGMHGYGVGCKRGDEKLFVGHEETKCIYDDFRCMNDISPEYVVKRFNRMIKHSNSKDYILKKKNISYLK